MFFFPESVLYRLVSDYNLIVWIPRCVYLLGQNTPVNPMRGTRCLWCLYFSAECDSAVYLLFSTMNSSLNDGLLSDYCQSQGLSPEGWVPDPVLCCSSESLENWPAGIVASTVSLGSSCSYNVREGQAPLSPPNDNSCVSQRGYSYSRGGGSSFCFLGVIPCINIRSHCRHLLPQVWLAQTREHTILWNALQQLGDVQSHGVLICFWYYLGLVNLLRSLILFDNWQSPL